MGKIISWFSKKQKPIKQKPKEVHMQDFPNDIMNIIDSYIISNDRWVVGVADDVIDKNYDYCWFHVKKNKNLENYLLSYDSKTCSHNDGSMFLNFDVNKSLKNIVNLKGKELRFRITPFVKYNECRFRISSSVEILSKK
jgi:hypothetical protein